MDSGLNTFTDHVFGIQARLNSKYEVEGGFPHSEILGSKLVRSSPRLIAAYHVLHRLSAPRHPPNALKTLDHSHDRCPPLGSDRLDPERPLAPEPFRVARRRPPGPRACLPNTSDPGSSEPCWSLGDCVSQLSDMFPLHDFKAKRLPAHAP